MVDLESRLRESLAASAEAAEDSTRLNALAAGARNRLRRRRTAMAKLVAGVAIVALAPFGIASMGRNASDPPSAPKVPDAHFIVHDVTPHPSRRFGMDEMTWQGIRFLVPPEWRPGVPTAWCAEGADPATVAPRIALPRKLESEVVCSPTSGYGVTVAPAAASDPGQESRYVFHYDAGGVDTRAAFPDGAWVAYWYDDKWVITIVTPDPGLTSRIVLSVRGKEIDSDGCSVGHVETVTRGTLVHPVSVEPCVNA